MSVEEQFKERYKSGNTPWDIGEPDFNLIQAVTAKGIKPCKALEIGCGSGNNSVWLAQNNFEVTGIDASEIAIEKALERASQANVHCTFMVTDFLKNKLEQAPFDFAFDRGCFHAFKSPEERKIFAENVASHLKKDGLWLSISGNADEQRNLPGPPQLSAGNIVNSIEPYFEILSLTASHFTSNRANPPRAWVCLLRKRNLE